MLSADGVKIGTSSEGTTAAISDKAKPLWLSHEIRPDLSKQFEIIFDVPPDQNYTLTRTGAKFHVYLG